MSRNLITFAVVLLWWCPPSVAQLVNMGLTRLAQEDGGTTTIFYRTLASVSPVSQGPFRLSWAEDGEPLMGNARLIVVSHGSGGSPWVHTDLARTLIQRGFVVAIPQHAGDNYLDPSEPGPASCAGLDAELDCANAASWLAHEGVVVDCGGAR